VSKQLGRTPADLALDTEMITTARQNLQKEFGTVAFQMDTPTQQKYLAAMAKTTSGSDREVHILGLEKTPGSAIRTQLSGLLGATTTHRERVGDLGEGVEPFVRVSGGSSVATPTAT
jgi:hypothetical protein